MIFFFFIYIFLLKSLNLVLNPGAKLNGHRGTWTGCVNRFFKSHLRLQNTFSRFLLQIYSVLSSAKLQTFDFVIEKNKSLINILKSRGSRTEPFDTPVLIPYHETNAKPILVYCLQFRSGSRAAATFKMECFVIIVNGWKRSLSQSTLSWMLQQP